MTAAYVRTGTGRMGMRECNSAVGIVSEAQG